MIEVSNLTKKFNGFTAVDDISFNVGKGEIFAFLGPNGAGKTTTIKILTTLLRPTSGKIILNGKDVTKDKYQVRCSFGIVFQDPSLDDELTAYENMEFHGVIYHVPKKIRRERIEQLLKFVELWDRKDDLVKKFSGGMKRRLEVARGLIHHPKILFLDEPTLGLDPQTRNHIWNYIKDLNKQEGMTIFFTTHYMEEAEKAAQKVAIIDHGKIVARGTPAELRQQTNTASLEDAFLALKNMQTIYILWLRQLKRYFRSKARIIGSLGQPILFLVALGFGMNPIYQKAGGGNYIQFLAPGIIAMGIIFTALFSGIEIIWDRQFGFLKETLVAPTSRLKIMIGRTLGGATVASFQGIMVLALSFLLGFRFQNILLLPVALIFIFLIALLFTGIGTAIASILKDMQGFQLIMNFLVMPLFFLSGALFPLEGLPKTLSIIASVNPLSYGVDGLRGSLINSAHFGMSTDLIILSILTGLILVLGAYLFSKIEV
jgi:daunorubicin resistance ABC transporter ATP-binding subunit/daunorubicin resistance ABC transporter membrane protein